MTNWDLVEFFPLHSFSEKKIKQEKSHNIAVTAMWTQTIEKIQYAIV